MMRYILITPAKNEEDNLPTLAECIIDQTILPKVWVIVDDSSTDKTHEIIENIRKRYSWIYVKTRNESSEYGHLSFAVSVKLGYEYAKKICKKNKIDYDYVAKIDADVMLPDDYFEKLMGKFEKNSKLGVACGAPHIVKKELWKPFKDFLVDGRNTNDVVKRIWYIPNEFPDERLYKKECLDEIGAFPITYAPDSIMHAKAKLRGWETKLIEDTECYLMRKTSSGRGLWNGFKTNGYVKYYLNYHPAVILLNALYELTKKPHYHAFPYILGYFSSFVKREEKIDDQEIRNYFRHERSAEIKKVTVGELNDIIANLFRSANRK